MNGTYTIGILGLALELTEPRKVLYPSKHRALSPAHSRHRNHRIQVVSMFSFNGRSLCRHPTTRPWLHSTPMNRSVRLPRSRCTFQCPVRPLRCLLDRTAARTDIVCPVPRLTSVVGMNGRISDLLVNAHRLGTNVRKLLHLHNYLLRSQQLTYREYNVH